MIVPGVEGGVCGEGIVHARGSQAEVESDDQVLISDANVWSLAIIQSLFP